MKQHVFLVMALTCVIALTPGCKKEEDPGGSNSTGNNNKGPSKLALISNNIWKMKDVELNGSVVTDKGTTPYEFKSNGTFNEARDGSGNWKYVSTWKFLGTDSTTMNVRVGQSNQDTWIITSLKEDELKIDYTATNGDKFKFGFIPE